MKHRLAKQTYQNNLADDNDIMVVVNSSTMLLFRSLIDEGGDWDRRNRLKVYKAVHCMANRKFKVI